ncbi:DUF5681 domain-containing protein [Methylobacterium persicinum]|uniref:DUF5681 domain-containing protein n=1 Tax=Methylobacterium persicinum TaxID=374426 RepID=A0ABU0HSA0_9HYPH|nr:DUF5681 domain-containing protein [Methylobacterium persicinum]MDQ0445203.1 hypothetical protein [Methylobacterium persicinum]GJE37830.1 hypothetical protein KHHGKMAE_1892 [Methylobacterium persicinum]
MIGTPFEPGKSGNPNGRPKIPAEVRELARSLTVEAIETHAEIMRDKAAPPAARGASANAILDRAWGKPTQPIDGDGEGGAIRSLVEIRFVKPGEE